MICVIAQLKARPEKVEDARAVLASTAASTRQESGCLQYDLHVSVEDPTSFALYERWRDKAALDAHFKMPYVQALFGRVAELLVAPPSMTVYTLHG
jgi:quinol monooxygenase YgiN